MKILPVFFLSAAALLAGCADSNKIGSTVKGTRISVMDEAKTVEADKGLKGAKPALPRMLVNLSWPQAGYDGQHAMPYADLAATPKLLWSQRIGEGSDSDFKLLASPVVDKGVVYTMDARGLVRAFNAQTGARLWERDTTPKDSEDEAIGGGVAVDGATVYATTGFGDVYALDAQTGAPKWTKSLMKPLRAAPTIADNHVYVVSIDNELTALDAATGSLVWHQSGISESATLMGASSPAVEGDNVVIAYNSGEMYDLRAQNGRALWNYALTAPAQVGALPAIADIRGLPVIDHGRVYAVSHSGRMAAIDQRTGDKAWEADIGGIHTPVVAGDALFVYGGDGKLMALARDSGRVMWAKALPQNEDPKDASSDRVVWAGPLLAGERLWMVNALGQLASFSPNDGAPVDTLDLGKPLYLTPIVADHTMYVLADDGVLMALR